MVSLLILGLFWPLCRGSRGNITPRGFIGMERPYLLELSPPSGRCLWPYSPSVACCPPSVWALSQSGWAGSGQTCFRILRSLITPHNVYDTFCFLIKTQLYDVEIDLNRILNLDLRAVWIQNGWIPRWDNSALSPHPTVTWAGLDFCSVLALLGQESLCVCWGPVRTRSSKKSWLFPHWGLTFTVQNWTI